jgi:hypothetical protein
VSAASSQLVEKFLSIHDTSCVGYSLSYYLFIRREKQRERERTERERKKKEEEEEEEEEEDLQC